jgi:putative inorganic carbon (HCO3(-)) transporter
MEKLYMNLWFWFFGLYVFLIYPWGKSYYYANAKAWYFMGFMLLLSFLFLLKERNKLIWKWTIVDRFIVLFLGLIVVSTLHGVKSSWVGVGTEHQGFFMMLSCIIVFKLASRFHAVHMERLIHIMIYSSFFACIYSILQYFHLGFLPQDAVYRSLFNHRTYSFFDNPDYFGTYLVLVIPLTITTYLLTQKKKQLLFFFILCVQFLALVESQTRSAWLGTVLGFLLILAWVMFKRRGSWKKLAIGMLAALFIFSISNVASHSKILSRATSITNDAQKIITNNNAGSAGASRWDIWQKSLPIISGNFWFGTGPNTFQQVFYSLDQKEIKQYTGPKNTLYDENNDYLQKALTMGVPALLVYLLLLLVIIRKALNPFKKWDPRLKLLSVGMLAAIIGYLVQAFFNISVVSIDPYFWLILGLLYAAGHVPKMKDE